jgi:hypothetical protein
LSKFICPACGTEVTLEQLSQAADVLALHRAAAVFGDDWPLIREYLDLFKGKRALKITKLVRLAREVWKMWQAGGFEQGRAFYRVGREEFRTALKATCNQASPGLTNHNYLCKVLMAAAEKTSQRRERELREKEKGLRTIGLRTAGETLAPLDACATVPQDSEWTTEFIRLNQVLRQARNPEAKAAAKAALDAHLAAGPPETAL